MKVHLCGSIGLDSVDDVLSTLGRLLKDNLTRVPDGEPGGRRLWIGWQYPVLRSSPFLETDIAAAESSHSKTAPLRVRAGMEDAVRFGELGYAREARASYEDFKTAQRAEVLPAHVKFQVSLPTPFAVTYSYIARDARPRVESAYEAAMLREVDRICAAIPHHDLCIQWDVCTEMIMLDGRHPGMRPLPDMPGFVTERFARLCAAIPADVDVGFHLCYGDFEGRHFVEPLDMGKLVEMHDLLLAAAGRPIAYVHMPVPIGRSDDAYFAPLRNRTQAPATELYLGLLHIEDGISGAAERIAAAKRVVSDFGVAAECGLGHWKTPESVERMLELHAAVANPQAANNVGAHL
jgi:methionine synthase II (cobalamin-independent)